MTENLKVVLFTSRNKDNKDVPGFKQRSKTFLTTKDKDDKTLIDEFENWSEQGLYGETSRFYISVNSRDSDKINKAFVHYLLNNPQISPASYPQRVASVAAKKENASEFKWLFDFDEKKELIPEFISDIKNESNLFPELEKGKKVIAVPRLKKYGEHVNDHQLDIVESFDKLGYIIGITDVSQLEEALQRVKEFRPKKYIQNTGNIISIVQNFIDNN